MVTFNPHNILAFVSAIKRQNTLQIMFKDRVNAATALANIMQSKLGGNKCEYILVLGIARGGIIAANVVAAKLHANFDIVAPRKLREPNDNENSIGAVMSDGSIYLNETVIKSLHISDGYIEKENEEQLREIRRRIGLYRPHGRSYNISDRIVVLIDDGIATGATVISTARWIRKQNPKRLIVGSPICSKRAISLLENEQYMGATLIDSIETILEPSDTKFVKVSQFYKQFEQVTDEKILEIMEKQRNDDKS